MTAFSWRTPGAWAVAAPVLCAIHCAAGPLVVLALPALAPAAEAEGSLLALTALLVGAVLIHGLRVHRNPVPGSGAAAGLVLWGASLAGWLLPIPEPVTTVVGSLTVAGAMLWNTALTVREVQRPHRSGVCHGGAPRHALLARGGGWRPRSRGVRLDGGGAPLAAGAPATACPRRNPMPTYTYETIPAAPGEPVRRFDVRQAMSDPPLTSDPETGEAVKRVFSAGYGVMTRGAGASGGRAARAACALGSGCGCAM